MKKLWIFFSYLFHPVLMPTLGMFLVLWNDPNLQFPLDTNAIDLALVFSCTLILPLFISWILLLFGMISSLTHPTENDRRLLLAIAILCFIIPYYCFHNIMDPGQSIKLFLLGINISIITTLIASLFTYVSFHSVGAGGLLGTTLGVIHYTQESLILWLIGAFVIVILAALSRYKLRAHSAFDIYIGLIIGIATQAMVFFFPVQVV